MKPRTIDYASPSRRPRFPTWLLAAGPLILFGLGLGAYTSSRVIKQSPLSRHEFYGNLRVALEGFSMLLLALGSLWGMLAAIRTRKTLALMGLFSCAVAFAFVVYHLLLSVKK